METERLIKTKKIPAIKICGIRREEETEYLNEAGVEYAGFVLYEKSRRYIEIAEAENLFRKLNKDIKKVAVVVNPDAKLAEEVKCAGFDIMQIHGEFLGQAKAACTIPVWRAVNLQENRCGIVQSEQNALPQGILLDAKEFGSGKTFDWQAFCENAREDYSSFRRALAKQNGVFILAGGLCSDNVAEGIHLFEPDVVDVSSNVEDANGKNRKKILEFVHKVREEVR